MDFLRSVADIIIHLPEYKTVNLVEAVWMATGIFTVLFCARHIRPLLKDYNLARNLVKSDPAKEYLLIVSFSYVRREVVRMFQGALIIGLGIYAMSLPSPGGHAVITPVGIVVTGVLMLIGASAALQSWWDNNTRGHILRILDVTSEEIIRERAADDEVVPEEGRQSGE